MVLKAHERLKESRWNERAWFMYTLAALFKTSAKKFPKTMKEYLYESVRKKPVKGIDETAIMARLRSYQKQRALQ